jgi:hypothetical protein
VQKETSAKGGGRRRSAFAEEEEGYMFVEEGFRVRFANGEVIDFYADSTEAKEEWMRALSQVVGQGIVMTSIKEGKSWTDMVLKREKSVMRKHVSEGRRGTHEVPMRKSSAQKAQEQQHHQSAPAAPVRPKSPVRQQTAPMMQSGIPSPAAKRSVVNARGSTGHMRTESFQPASNGSRSTANSPVKSKFGFGGLSSEERRRKARSMLM